MVFEGLRNGSFRLKSQPETSLVRSWTQFLNLESNQFATPG